MALKTVKTLLTVLTAFKERKLLNKPSHRRKISVKSQKNSFERFTNHIKTSQPFPKCDRSPALTVNKL